MRSTSTSLLRASRRALVATALTWVTIRSAADFWKRTKASVAACIVGSVIWPCAKASAPRRTGARTELRFCTWPSGPRRATAMRIPFEPASMAAMFFTGGPTAFRCVAGSAGGSYYSI